VTGIEYGQNGQNGFSRAAIEKTQYLIKNPHSEVREEKKRGAESPGHTMVKAAMQRHPAMLRQNQTSGSLCCHDGTAKTTQTRWRRNETGAPPPVRCRERPLEPT
jgi:hypothetical protein